MILWFSPCVFLTVSAWYKHSKVWIRDKLLTLKSFKIQFLWKADYHISWYKANMPTNVIGEWYTQWLQIIKNKYMTEDMFHTALPQISSYHLLDTLVCSNQGKRVICLSGHLLFSPIATTCNLSFLVGISSLPPRLEKWKCIIRE